MSTKQTIAIIGATSFMGSTISKALSKGNYRLLLFAEEKDKVQALAEQIKTNHSSADIEMISSYEEASWEADMIISTLPSYREKEIAQNIKAVANQKIFLSVTDPSNSSLQELPSTSGKSEAEELQYLLPDTKVIKAFNSTFAADFSKPAIHGKQVDVFITGNDKDGLQTVLGLILAVGLNPVIAGDLSASRTFENMQAYSYPLRNQLQIQLVNRLENKITSYKRQKHSTELRA